MFNRFYLHLRKENKHIGKEERRKCKNKKNNQPKWTKKQINKTKKQKKTKKLE